MTYEEYKKLRDSGKKPEEIANIQEKTTFQDKGLIGSVGEIGKGILKGAGSTLYGLEQLGEKGARIVGKAITGKDAGQQITKPKILEATNALQKLGFGAEQIAEFLLPATKLAKVEKGFETAGKVAQNVPKIEKILAEAKILGKKSAVEASTTAGIASAQSGGVNKESLIAGGIGGAFPIVGKTISGIGKITSKGGKTAFETAFTPNAKEAALLQSAKAFGTEMPRTAGVTALEQGLAGTKTGLGVKATQKQDKIWTTKIQPAVSGIKEKIKTADLFSDVEKGINKIADPSRRKAMMDGLEALKEDYANLPNMTYEQAQKIKSELYKFIPAKMFRGQDVAGSYNTIRKALADSIRTRTYKKLENIDIKKDYLDWGNLQNIRESGIRAMQDPKFKGGFGGFMGGLKDMVVTPVSTYGGKTLYKAGNGIRFLGDKGINGLAEYLEKLAK